MANVNLLDMAKNYLSPDVLKRCGAALGETPENIQKGLGSAVPAVLGGFARQASSDPTGASVTRLLAEGQRGGEKASDLSSVIGGGPKAEAFLGKGRGMLGRLFGDRLPSVVDEVAGRSGLSQTSAGKILALAVPIIGAVVSREAAARKLNPAGLASMLAGQKGAVGATETGGLVQTARTERTAAGMRYETPEGKPAGRRIGLPLILAAVIGLLGLLLFSSSRRKEVAITTPALPRFQAPSVPAPTVEVSPPAAAVPSIESPTPPAIGGGPSAGAVELNQFFADRSQTTPKRISLEDLNFDNDSDRLSPAAGRSLDDVATALNAHLDATVLIEGFTDNSGDPQHNLTLSANRANAVRDALLGRGVDGSRMAVAGRGAANPAAPNETTEGRAENRRIELVVMRR